MSGWDISMNDIRTTELIVVRHGETLWNCEGRLQGHMNSDLTPLGIQQAKAVAERLSKINFVALYSSDLNRALHTAEFIADRTRHKIITDSRLRERKLGIFESLTHDEILERYPQEYVRVRSGDPDYVCPEGESLQQKFDRTTSCVMEIVARHVGHRVVIVTHGGVLDDLFRLAIGIPLGRPRKFRLFNASLNFFFVQGNNWVLGTWGDISHLNCAGAPEEW